MPPVYLLEAAQCPAPYAPSGLHDPNAAAPANPLVLPAFASGETSGVSYKQNKVSRYLENLARYGGGAYAVAAGLELEDAGGRVIRMTTGVQMCDAPIIYSAVKTIEIPDNLYDSGDLSSRAHIWLSRSGDLTYRTDLTLPATPSIYLGSVRTDGGAIYDIDYSGRLILGGGFVFRRTADATTPADTPPSTIRFWNRTESGFHYWTGEEYVSPLDPDHTVIAEGGDPSPGALDAKTLAGSGIALAVVTDSGIKKLRVSTDPGALAYKVPVRAASTGNLTLAGEQTIDGVSCVAGNRVLAKDQTDASENGIYVVAAGAWSRAADADASADVQAGMVVPVAEGDTQSDTLWVLATNDAITLETTELVFGQLSAVRHTEEFTVPIAQALGAICEYEVDFSARGSFAAAWDYHVRLTKDQAGVRVTVLDNDRTGSSFRVLVQIAYDAPDGTYGDYGELELEFALQGHRWTPGSSPSATPTATLDTYDYEGSAAEGGPIQRVRVAATAGAIPDSDGADIVATGTYGEAGPLNLELPEAPVSMQKVTIVAGTTTPVNVSPGSGEWPGGSSISLDNEGSSCVFQCIWPPEHSGPGAPPVWALLSYVDATITP